MYVILVTQDHIRDFVSRNNRPVKFHNKEAATKWIQGNGNENAVYKVKEDKPRKAKPLHRKRRKKAVIKEVSFEMMVEKGVIQ